MGLISRVSSRTYRFPGNGWRRIFSVCTTGNTDLLRWRFGYNIRYQTGPTFATQNLLQSSTYIRWRVLENTEQLFLFWTVQFALYLSHAIYLSLLQNIRGRKLPRPHRRLYIFIPFRWNSS